MIDLLSMSGVRYRSIKGSSFTGELVEAISVKSQFLFFLLFVCDSCNTLTPVPAHISHASQHPLPHAHTQTSQHSCTFITTLTHITKQDTFNTHTCIVHIANNLCVLV